MSIAAICQPEVITIDAGASLRDAANSMRAHHIGALVVTVEAAGHEQAVGVITDRDLAIEILARDLMNEEMGWLTTILQRCRCRALPSGTAHPAPPRSHRAGRKSRLRARRRASRCTRPGSDVFPVRIRDSATPLAWRNAR